MYCSWVLASYVPGDPADNWVWSHFTCSADTLECPLARVKRLEERLLQLEAQSPEYHFVRQRGWARENN